MARRSSRTASSCSHRTQILEAARTSQNWVVNGDDGIRMVITAPGRAAIVKLDGSEEISLHFTLSGALVAGRAYTREHRGNRGTFCYLLKEYGAEDVAELVAYVGAE